MVYVVLPNRLVVIEVSKEVQHVYKHDPQMFVSLLYSYVIAVFVCCDSNYIRLFLYKQNSYPKLGLYYIFICPFLLGMVSVCQRSQSGSMLLVVESLTSTQEATVLMTWLGTVITQVIKHTMHVLNS